MQKHIIKVSTAARAWLEPLNGALKKLSDLGPPETPSQVCSRSLTITETIHPCTRHPLCHTHTHTRPLQLVLVLSAPGLVSDWLVNIAKRLTAQVPNISLRSCWRTRVEIKGGENWTCLEQQIKAQL